MNEKKIITLDLTGCKSLDELHQRIKGAFNFPNFYGKNWDAFWDLLWSECDADKVEIIGENTLPKDFIWHLEKMHEVLQDNKDEHKLCEWSPFDFEILS
ncbi:barstar family protein [Oscillospiraceae bacterium MB08-C2-2]|nr:barstar family protein [Oscillospiraceae bacterium MB08-C2-2]